MDARLRFAAILSDGINRMQIPFVDSTGARRPKPKTKDEAMAFLNEWTKWWNQHGEEVLRKPKEAP
jgi:hypothetical protein